MMPNAKAIYQTFLDETSSMIWDHDHAAYAARMKYPYRMHTAAKDTLNKTTADTEACSRSFRENLTSLGAQAYHRICNMADFETSGRILGTHTSYVLRGATALLQPFKSRLVLHLENGVWLGGDFLTEIRNADLKINSAIAANFPPIERAP